MTRSFAFAALAVALTANAADIQKCADTSGHITYQDSPCPRGSTIGTVPRDSARADPAALRELAHQRQRLERAIDAQLTATSPSAQPMPIILASPATTAGAESVYAYPYAYAPATASAQNGTATQVADASNAAPTAITQPPGTVAAVIAQPPVGTVTSVPALPAIMPAPGTAARAGTGR